MEESTSVTGNSIFPTMFAYGAVQKKWRGGIVRLKHNKVVVFHPAGDGVSLAFDIFVRAGERIPDKLEEELYEADCPVIREVLNDNPDYIYIGSEDLLHEASINFAVIKLLLRLHDEGFKFEFVNTPAIASPLRRLLMDVFGRFLRPRGERNEEIGKR